VSGSRALQLTSSGRAGLPEIFQIEVNNESLSRDNRTTRKIGEDSAHEA
jgi:hypothetical protein